MARYKYTVMVKIRGKWERWGECDSNCGAVAHDISDEVMNCEDIKFIEN